MEVTNLIINMISIVIQVALLIYVYKISKEYSKNIPLWLVLTFFFGLLPAGILLIQVGKKALGIVFIILWVLSILLIFGLFFLLFAAAIAYA